MLSLNVSVVSSDQKSSQSIAVELRPDQTVSALKDALEAQSHIKFQEQVLVHQGVILPNSAVLRDVSPVLRPNARLLLLRQRPPPPPAPKPVPASALRPSADDVIIQVSRLVTPELMAPLLEMGFSEGRVRKALLLNLLNPHFAMEWLLEHMEDPDADEPLLHQHLVMIARSLGMMNTPVVPAPVRRAMDMQVCTFTVTARNFAAQPYVRCVTCGLDEGKGCCMVCAQRCHAGHRLSQPINSDTFFCDCGAGDCGVTCSSLHPPPTEAKKDEVRSPTSAENGGPSSSGWLQRAERAKARLASQGRFDSAVSPALVDFTAFADRRDFVRLEDCQLDEVDRQLFSSSSSSSPPPPASSPASSPSSPLAHMDINSHSPVPTQPTQPTQQVEQNESDKAQRSVVQTLLDYLTEDPLQPEAHQFSVDQVQQIETAVAKNLDKPRPVLQLLSPLLLHPVSVKLRADVWNAVCSLSSSSLDDEATLQSFLGFCVNLSASPSLAHVTLPAIPSLLPVCYAYAARSASAANKHDYLALLSNLSLLISQQHPSSPALASDSLDVYYQYLFTSLREEAEPELLRDLLISLAISLRSKSPAVLKSCLAQGGPEVVDSYRIKPDDQSDAATVEKDLAVRTSVAHYANVVSTLMASRKL